MKHAIRRAAELVSFAALVFVASQRMHANDLYAYYWAATQALADVHRVYAVPPIETFGRSVPPFVYAPTAIPLFLPLTWLAPSGAAWLWFGLSTAAAGFTSFGLVRPILAEQNIAPVATTMLVISTFFNYPLYATLLTGQVNALVGLLLLGFYVLHVRGRPVPGAVCLALAIAIKVYPAIFLITLARKRRVVELGVVVITFLAMVSLTFALFPAGIWSEWIAGVASTGGFGRSLPALAPDLLAYNVSINGTLMRVVGPGRLAGSLAIAIGVAMIFLSVSGRNQSADLDAAEVAALGLVMFCAAPISWVHHLAMVIPVAALATATRTRHAAPAGAYAMMCFKWDWAAGSLMLAGVSPATVGSLVLWLQTSRHTRVTS